MTSRISQQYFEIVVSAAGEARITNQTVEVLAQTEAEARISTQYTEFLGQIEATGRISTQYTEFAGQIAGNVRITRQHVELLKKTTPDAAVVAVTLQAIEAAATGTFVALTGDATVFSEMDRPVYDTIEVVDYTTGNPNSE